MLNAIAQPRKSCQLFLLLAPAFAQLHTLTARSPHVFSMILVQYVSKKDNFFNILWVLVFGFATLNILGLVARRFDSRNRFSFGEAIAIMVVVVSVGLLGWELLTVFKVFPLKLNPR
jgi:hypothetical protein